MGGEPDCWGDDLPGTDISAVPANGFGWEHKFFRQDSRARKFLRCNLLADVVARAVDDVRA